MTRDRRAFLSAGVVVSLFLPPEALAQELRLGAEFQVNTFTDNRQRFPSVATEANGDFVVVWESYFQDGSSVGIFGARFSSAGASLATEFQINTFTSDMQNWPAMAADADGDFIVA